MAGEKQRKGAEIRIDQGGDGVRIGWVGVSPEAATGYGRATREILSRLIVEYDIICIGHVADVIVWGGKKPVTLPNGEEILTLAMTNPMNNPDRAVDMIKLYSRKHNLDFLVGFWDAFALEFLRKQDLPYMVYVPIDGPMTPKWKNYIRDAYKVILYSQYAYQEALKFFSPSQLSYIPHGVDCKTFRPLDIDKDEVRQSLDVSPDIPEDCFLYLFVGANVGDRKKIPLLINTFKKLVEEHPDTHLLLHTNPYARVGKGYDLPMFLDMLDLKENVHLPTYNPILEGLSDEKMCKMYNSAEVYVTNSVAEGFGMPVTEAQACGLPVIAPKNSAQIELVEGHGWMVDNVPKDQYIDFPIYVPQLTYYPVPDQRCLLEKMEEAYHLEGVRREYGRMSREFILKYDWDKVIPRWFDLLESINAEVELLDSLTEAEKTSLPIQEGGI